MNWNIIPDLLEKGLIPIIIGLITYLIARKQLINTGVTQFRQRWIDELRKAVTLYIAKAELISIIDLDDEESYLKNFQELVQMQYQIELMLNPGEEEHNKLNVITSNIRKLIHDDRLKPETLERLLSHKIDQLLGATKVVLKKEWIVVKNGK